MQRSFIVSLAAVLLLVILVLQNTTSTPIHLFFWKFEAPLILLIVIAALLGALVSFFLALGPARKIKGELAEARRRVNELESALKPQSTAREENQKTE
ncbi:MAG TPA: LapA family protein [Bacteroidales bacterium]|nr:LapA family protein [Bacteroidales bacterium]HRZ76121.1 LapA family protein [Bacteroidales bacterium]